MVNQNLFGYSLQEDKLYSVISPKVGAPILTSFVNRLRSAIPIKFTFQEILLQSIIPLLNGIGVVVDYNEELTEAQEAFTDERLSYLGVGGTTPYRAIGMSFEFKKNFYELVDLFVGLLVNDDSISLEQKTELETHLSMVQRFVGLPEGDGEDYHFMVAVYYLMKAVDDVLNNIPVPPV